MTAPRPKIIGSTTSPLMAGAIGSLLVGFGVFYGGLQLAARMDSGQWLRGGANPGSALIYWVRDGARFGPSQIIAVAGLFLLVLIVFGLVLWMLGRRGRTRTPIDESAKYLGDSKVFTEAAIRKHAADAGLTTGEVVGLAVAVVVRTGQWFWAGFRDGMTCVMGPGSNKTTAVVIPLALDAPGPAWVTSNRPDVVAALYTSRQDKGRFWCFDPQRVADMPATWYYDPLGYIRERPEEADTRSEELAQHFASAGRPADARTDVFFDEAGRTLNACLLLAAALDNQPITQVLQWVSSRKNPRAVDILRQHDQIDSVKQLEGFANLAADTANSIYQTAATQIRFLKNRSARAWVQRMGPDDDRPEFRPAEFVRSSGDLMVSLSREGVGSFGPLIAAMTRATIKAAEDYAATRPNGRLPVPLVMPLDEVANVCRIHELPDLISHAGGRGIFLMPIVQSPAQGKATWGADGWDKLWGASVIRLVGRGLIDTDFLEGISKAIGDQDVQRVSHSKSSGRGGGSRSSNTGWTTERIMPVSKLVELPQKRAVVIAAGDRGALLRLVPWFERDEMRALVGASQAAFVADHPSVELDDDPVAVDVA
ncbi:MAG TPA: TraM recognition domain-containing protein [Candidatus Limnocylindrales bacterium]